jgi:response regulator RpfG family c-di-GMP phosphodiesterase
MRRDHKLVNVPIIAVTGIADSSKLARLRELGVKSILHKVRFTFDALLKEVHENLGQKADR